MGRAECEGNYGETFCSLLHSGVVTHCVSCQANNLLKKRFPSAVNKLKRSAEAYNYFSLSLFSLRKTSNHNESFGRCDPCEFITLQKKKN